MKSVVLIEPTYGHDKKHATGGHNEFEPLGLEYIEAVLRSRGYKTKLLRQMSEANTILIKEIVFYDPDLVCFTVLSYNYPEALHIADSLKLANENIKIVFGGYHPSTVPEDVAREEAIDFVVIGEGEETIVELCAALENNDNIESVPGVAYMSNGQYVKTNDRRRISNLDALPFPSRCYEILKECRVYGLMLPPPSKQISTATIACSRGCPYNCEFCCSRTVWGKGVTHRTPQNVIQEIMEVQRSFKSNSFFFTDLTFNSDKNWVLDLCQEIIMNGLTFNWYCMCTIVGLDQQLIETMSKAGCRKIGFGIERLEDDVSMELKSFRRPSIAEMNNVFELCSHNRIFTKSYFMIGLPTETMDDLVRFKNAVSKLLVDEIKISFYTPFPGTPSYEKHKDRLIYTDYSHYDTLNHLVVRNDFLSEQEFKKFRTEVIQSFYNSDEYATRAKNKIKRNPDLMGSYIEFLAFMKFDQKITDGILGSDNRNDKSINC